jgi:hypothetical protein
MVCIPILAQSAAYEALLDTSSGIAVPAGRDDKICGFIMNLFIIGQLSVSCLTARLRDKLEL